MPEGAWWEGQSVAVISASVLMAMSAGFMTSMTSSLVVS